MRDKIKQISRIKWEIPRDPKLQMNVPAHIYVNEEMLGQVLKDRALMQLINVCSLPGIQSQALVMPDVHEGYGFPIGAVAAIDVNDGVISPGGIGYDINCGVRLLRTDLSYKDIQSKKEDIAREIYKTVPTGVGKGGRIRLSEKDLNNILNSGCRWAEKEGYTEESDLLNIESFGSLESADAKAVSEHAKNRGRNQLGTMGAGNHFIEINRVQNIFDEEAAEIFGLKKGQVVIQLHTGSRGLGHQVATDYVKRMLVAANKYDIILPDRELSCAPFNSDEGREYFAAMSAAANYAWTNRQLISSLIREAWHNVFGKKSGNLSLLYDVAHNIAKIEEHEIRGQKKKVLVHRKGSTRAFPKGHPEVPARYRSVGQPVLIPGSMGTSSYVLAGMPDSMKYSFGSACHGAGRALSRTAARKKVRGDELMAELRVKGIAIQAGSKKGVAEEAPVAYKDIESVVDVVEEAGIARKVARLKPVAVIKG